MERIFIINFEGADIGLKPTQVIVEILSLPEIDIFKINYKDIVKENCLHRFSR